MVIGLVAQPGSRTGVEVTSAKDPSSVGSWWSYLRGLVHNSFLALDSKTSATTEAAGDGFASTATTSLSSTGLRIPFVDRHSATDGASY